jgi:hypothetical protein
MAEFKDAIRAAGGKLEYLHQPDGRLAFQISGDMRALYMVAVSMDGRRLLDTVPATGIGQTAVYPQPSVVAYVQSDEQGMWGRNCPACEKYFRTTHIHNMSVCPYCAKSAPSLTFISKAQRLYIAASYDAFGRATVIGGETLLRDNPVCYPVRDMHGEREIPAVGVTIPFPVPGTQQATAEKP